MIHWIRRMWFRLTGPRYTEAQKQAMREEAAYSVVRRGRELTTDTEFLGDDLGSRPHCAE